MNGLTRREVLRSTLAVVGLALPPLRTPWAQPADADIPHPPETQKYTYFEPAEIEFLKAAVDRFIPKDDLGPGAVEAGVVFFLDQQMAGRYGRAETWYMQGPWREGTSEQGYQHKLTPAQLYRAAIRAVDAYCRAHYDGKAFAALTTDEQDKLLLALDNEEVKLDDAPGKDFIELLWKNTQEGFLADPVYGGNRDFIGWKLIGFPGPRYNYTKEIEQYGQRYGLPTVGLMGRQDPNSGKR